MSFPTVYKEIRRLAVDTAWETPTARDIARKAGITLRGSTTTSADIWGTFSEVNDETFGFVCDYVPDVEAFYFPDDTERMSRYSDMQGVGFSRLLVTVTQGGTAGSSLGIASDEITFASSIQIPLDVVGLHVSPWAAMTPTQDNVYSRWVVGNPSMEAGSFAVGLCQWQVR